MDDLRTARLEKAVAKLRCALQAHHNWHMSAGEMGVYKDDSGHWLIQNMTAEYGDSTMCELTTEALQFSSGLTE